MMMLFLLLFASPSHAESPPLPPEMRQKVDEAAEAVAEGYKQAQLRLAKSERSSGLVHGAAEDLRHIWAIVKNKSRHALIYLDHQLHAHVIGEEPR